MAKRRPIVLNETTGELELLQAGDNIQEVDIMTLINGEATSIIKGTPVYISAAGTVKIAKGDAPSTSNTIGIVADPTIASGVSGPVQSEGVITATTGEWDTVTGDSGGLVPGLTYWLSPSVAGMITKVAPSTGYYQVIGIALSTTDMQLSIGRRIKF